MDTVFQIHGLRRFFDVIVTREMVRKLKPDPEGLLQAASSLGATTFAMIGDSIHDVSAAKNANGISIMIKSNTKETLDPQPDYLVQSLSEVPAIIQAAMIGNSSNR